MYDKMLLKVVDKRIRETEEEDEILAKAVQDTEHTKVGMLVIDKDGQLDEVWHSRILADNPKNLDFMDFWEIGVMLDMAGFEIVKKVE